MVLQIVSTPSAMKEWPYKWYGLSWGGQFSIIFLSQSILNLAFSGSGLISGIASPEGDNLVLFFWPLVVVTL